MRTPSKIPKGILKSGIFCSKNNFQKWPDTGTFSRFELLQMGFTDGSVKQLERRRQITNLYPHFATPYRQYEISELKTFLINRKHAGPGSKSIKK